MKKYNLYTIALLVSLCYSCKNDDPEPVQEGTYTKDWVLDINKQSSLDPNVSRTYSAILLDDSLLLINHHSSATSGFLIEVNYSKGTVKRSTPGTLDKFKLGKTNDKVLLLHEEANTKTYTLGTYDYKGNGDIVLSSPLEASALSPEDGELTGIEPGASGTFYTHGTKPGKEGAQQAWVAKWNYTGTNLWTDTLDTRFDPSVFALQEISDKHIGFTGKYDYRKKEGKKWIAGDIEPDHGELRWADTVALKWVDMVAPKPVVSVAISSKVNYMAQNQITESMYAFSLMGFSKFDPSGRRTLTNPMKEFEDYTIITQPALTAISWLFVAIRQGTEVTLVSTSDIKTAWREKYWEQTTEPLTLLSSPEGDVLVISANGFITKYKRNR